MKPAEIAKRLVQLSHELGREDRQLAILGEGNVSADLADGTFYVKASGSQLAAVDAVSEPQFLDKKIRIESKIVRTNFIAAARSAC